MKWAYLYLYPYMQVRGTAVGSSAVHREFDELEDHPGRRTCTWM